MLHARRQARPPRLAQARRARVRLLAETRRLARRRRRIDDDDRDDEAARAVRRGPGRRAPRGGDPRALAAALPAAAHAAATVHCHDCEPLHRRRHSYSRTCSYTCNDCQLGCASSAALGRKAAASAGSHGDKDGDKDGETWLPVPLLPFGSIEEVFERQGEEGGEEARVVEARKSTAGGGTASTHPTWQSTCLAPVFQVSCPLGCACAKDGVWQCDPNGEPTAFKSMREA